MIFDNRSIPLSSIPFAVYFPNNIEYITNTYGIKDMMKISLNILLFILMVKSFLMKKTLIF